MVDAKRSRNFALIGATAKDVRETMVVGSAEAPGLMSVWPMNQRPIYFPSRGLIRCHNGAIGHTYSAEKPNRLRGPNHDLAWGDEVAAWERAQDTWDNVMFGLRKGEARFIITTTPKRVGLMRKLLKDLSILWTYGSMYDNAANLSPAFVADMERRYAGTRLGRQELLGEMLEDVEGALVTGAMFEAARVMEAPDDLVRVIIGVDPSVSGKDKDDSGRKRDDCGIIAYGRARGGRKFILKDWTVNASPEKWAIQAVKAYHYHKADVLVAEKNNGGEMVRMTIEGVDRTVNVQLVTAGDRKEVRAEPMAADIERGDISVVGSLPEFEDEWTSWVPGGRGASPGRIDASAHAFNYDQEASSRAEARFIQ